MTTMDPTSHPTKSPVTRFVIWITRGELPVDGCEAGRKVEQVPPPAPAPPVTTEPLRWGNFR